MSITEVLISPNALICIKFYTRALLLISTPWMNRVTHCGLWTYKSSSHTISVSTRRCWRTHLLIHTHTLTHVHSAQRIYWVCPQGVWDLMPETEQLTCFTATKERPARRSLFSQACAYCGLLTFGDILTKTSHFGFMTQIQGDSQEWQKSSLFRSTQWIRKPNRGKYNPQHYMPQVLKGPVSRTKTNPVSVITPCGLLTF